jgi:hypothetical protein
MVGDFNIKKFLTENKVTVASQNLAELDVQNPEVTDSVKEFYELQQEMNTMKSRLKEMEARFKGFEGIIKPMLDEMKELGDKLAMAGEFVIKVNKFGGERMDASYKDAFENALSKVNAATKGVLQEALEASKKITQVKHSIDIQPANQLQEGIMDRISGAFKGFLSRLDQKVNNAAKAVEDFINLVADNVPGGEDVDDTPNPVLEKLSGNQDKLDKNNDGKISGEDFKMMKKEDINEPVLEFGGETASTHHSGKSVGISQSAEEKTNAQKRAEKEADLRNAKSREQYKKSISPEGNKDNRVRVSNDPRMGSRQMTDAEKDALINSKKKWRNK